MNFVGVNVTANQSWRNCAESIWPTSLSVSFPYPAPPSVTRTPTWETCRRLFTCCNQNMDMTTWWDNENTTGFLNVACVAQMISCLAHKGIEGEALENTEKNLTQVWVNSHIKHRRKTPIMFRHRCTVNYWMDRHFLTAATSGYHRYNGSTIKHFYHIE